MLSMHICAEWQSGAREGAGEWLSAVAARVEKMHVAELAERKLFSGDLSGIFEGLDVVV